MTLLKRPKALLSRHRHAPMRRPHGCRAWLLVREYEDEDDLIVGPGNDRADMDGAA